MAYAPLSKLVSIDTMSNVCLNNMIKPTLSEVLQSDSVKRLFNRPNLIIKTIPLKPLAEFDKNTSWHKRNDMNATSNYIKPSEISIFPIGATDEEKEDANLLPSKIKHKKSEIILFPIKKKSCGHDEPCENIVCDVTLQQYVDKDDVSPMLALSIEEEEINAPVEKHCGNKYCDALSIDHNRCRRALVKLYKCDKSHMCDICGITFKKRISRIYHNNCMRKKEYIHNNVNRLHLQRERMRMRELQILEIAKMKKHNYSDCARAIETLRRNEELIIIPQKVSSQRPIVTMTSIFSTQSTSPNLINAQPIKIDSQITKTTNIFGNMSLMVSSQNTVTSENTSRSESKVKSINQMRFSNLQQNSHLKYTSIPTPTSVQVQTQVSIPTSASISTLTPASISVPTLTLAISPTSISTPVSTSTPAPGPVSVPTLTLAVVPTSTPASTKISTSTSVPTLTLAPTPVSTPTSTSLVTTSALASVVSPHKQYIRLAVSSQASTVEPVTLNNWIVSPSRVLTTTPVQPKTFLAPIRVVPITNLISPPSLLHRTQGIPKFCIIAENLVTPMIVSKSPTVQPDSATADIAPMQEKTSNFLEHNPISKIQKTKLMKAKKNFFCIYCSKNLTTDWYFKKHVAKHKAAKFFSCIFCDKSFNNNYDMENHITNQHTKQKKLICKKCNYICKSLASFKHHVQIHKIRNRATTNEIVQSKKQKKLELLEIGKDQTNHKFTIRNTYKKLIKRIKCEDTSDKQNECVEKHNNELLTINVDSNAKRETKKFHFVSVKEIVKPEDFVQESVITSR